MLGTRGWKVRRCGFAATFDGYVLFPWDPSNHSPRTQANREPRSRVTDLTFTFGVLYLLFGMYYRDPWRVRLHLHAAVVASDVQPEEPRIPARAHLRLRPFQFWVLGSVNLGSEFSGPRFISLQPRPPKFVVRKLG